MDAQQQQAMSMAAGMMGFFFIFALIMMALIIIPLWRIATKAGIPGALSLLALIPGVGLLAALYVIAFMEWKVAPVPPGYAQGYPAPPTL